MWWLPWRSNNEISLHGGIVYENVVSEDGSYRGHYIEGHCMAGVSLYIIMVTGI